MAKLGNSAERGSMRSRLAWLPPFLAGGAAATAAELAAGLLLYSALGFLRALTIVLAVELGAFGLGLWSTQVPRTAGGLEWVRRRWLIALIAFSAAAAFSALPTVTGEVGTSATTRGLGLALLGGLPMFAIASLLGAMGRVQGPGSRGGATVGTAAAFGGAAGFLATGFVFVPLLEPLSILLVCVIALSAGALVYGWVADAMDVVTLLESRWTARGELRVEDRVRGAPRRRVRVLREAGRVRGAEDESGHGIRGFERAVVEGLQIEGGGTAPILLFGLGAGTLARRLAEVSTDRRVVGIEPGEEVWRLARAHFPVGREPDADAWCDFDAHAGVALEDLAEPAAATHLFGEELFALVILDLSAFPSSDAVPPLAPSEPARLLHLLDRDAVVLLGPLDFTEEGLVGLGAWAAAASEYPARRLHVRGGEGVLALFRSASSSSWSLERPLAVWDETGAEAVEPEPAGAGPAGNVTERAGGSVPEPASSSDPPVSGPGSVDLPRSTVGTEQ